MGDKDFKSAFRAARGSKPTKEQLKALKAQKAAAAAAQHHVAATEDTKSMPPPPPRPTSLPPPLQKPSSALAPPVGPGSYHPDSQGTRINNGGGATVNLQSEPSVNKQTAPQLYNNNNTSLVDSSNVLPTGFFEAAPAAAQGGQGSTGGGGGNTNLDVVVSKAAKSGEGSTGAALGGGGGGGSGGLLRGGSAGDFLVATSQLSAMVENEPNAVAPAGSNAVGEQSQQNTIINTTNTNTNTVEGGECLPRGFFDSSAAAAPQGTKASAAAAAAGDSKNVDMDKEFADFMKEVKVENASPAVAATAAVEEEDDDEGAKLAREDFEQFVRMERLREVKDAATTTGGAAGGANNGGSTQFVSALEEKPASALELAGVVADDVLPAPKLVLPRKRKIAETVALLEKENDGSDSESSSGDEDGIGMVDWRAKKSMAGK